MNLLQLYGSPQGRISRRTYWLGLFIPIFSFSVLFVSIEELIGKRLSDWWLLILAWPGIAISIKRWHDRNKAG